MGMTAIAVRCQMQDGSVSDTELPSFADPVQWTARDVREIAWAIQRALQAGVVSALRLVEVSAMEVWRIEVVANTGMATTRGLPRSSAAVVWLQAAKGGSSNLTLLSLLVRWAGRLCSR
ncbi:MAG: hypothetical protein ABI868_08505 [Acidobacteriota bacterium]